MKSRDWRFTVSGEKSYRREYVYRKPVRRPVQIDVPYYMDTEENKAIRYAMVCAGHSDNPMPPPMETTENVDVLVREREWYEQDGALKCRHISVWLMPNIFTRAKAPLEASWFTFKHLTGLDEISFIKSETERHVIAAIRGNESHSHQQGN